MLCFDLEPISAGDAFPGIGLLRIKDKLTGLPPASPLASARMRFKRRGRIELPVIELTSGAGGGVTVLDGALWELQVPEQMVPGLVEGVWDWNMETTPEDGLVKTYVGGTQTVNADV